MPRAVLALAALVAAASIAGAQPPPGLPPGPPPPAAPRGAPRAMPSRDRTPTAAGTAVIRGRVVSADSSKPLRRARITLSAPELGGDQRTASTGMDGRYEVTDLPAGRYTIR